MKTEAEVDTAVAPLGSQKGTPGLELRTRVTGRNSVQESRAQLLNPDTWPLRVNQEFICCNQDEKKT